MKNFLIYILCFFFNVVFVSGQEYIGDTCFDYVISPKSGSPAFNYVSLFWESPTKSTPDLFFENNPHPQIRISNNFIGKQFPHCNTGYAGIYAYTGDVKHFGPSWREYISIKLNNKLSSGNLYCLTLMVSLADTCKYAADGLEAYFSKSRINYPYTTNLPYDPQIRNIGGRIITEKKGWTKICSVYEAKGREKYLTIGNFKDDQNTTIIQVKEKTRKSDMISECAYYYIGMVSLKPIKSQTECECSDLVSIINSTEEMVDIDTITTSRVTYILREVNFDVDSYTLLPEAHSQLDSIYDVLKLSTTMIEINGYTDSTGSESHNLQLSAARAQAVADYFTSRGISEQRMIIHGFGSSRPIAENSTEEGRRKNRRVEITLIERRNQ